MPFTLNKIAHEIFNMITRTYEEALQNYTAFRAHKRLMLHVPPVLLVLLDHWKYSCFCNFNKESNEKLQLSHLSGCSCHHWYTCAVFGLVRSNFLYSPDRPLKFLMLEELYSPTCIYDKKMYYTFKSFQWTKFNLDVNEFDILLIAYALPLSLQVCFDCG